MILAEIVSGVMQGINGVISDRKINQWLKLIIELALSFWITGAAIFGASLAAALVASPNTPTLDLFSALAAASAAAAGAVFYQWRRSPLSKGMGITVPQILQGPENLQHIEHR